MVRNKRKWHPKFIEYTKFIAKHPNYNGIPEKYKNDGSVRWVVTGNSKLGKERAYWWDKQVKNLNVSNRAEVARKIHPKELNGMKPCQTCGKELSINYIYPNKNTLKKINELSPISFDSYDKSIIKIFKILKSIIGNNIYIKFREIFKIPSNINDDEKSFLNYIIKNRIKLSPGVMSNAPDRFDGFHSYNACCREKEDTGRNKDNLKRYTQDRRAYENWAEGNWNLANRLMGEYKRYEEEIICPMCGKKARVTADHIGPISLGFTHRAQFNPLCKSCNSAKNNRMTLDDVKILIQAEKQGNTVISWHSKKLWDHLKTEINSDDDALKLSKIMRSHIHNVLCVFAIINESKHFIFLKQFLKPEYSFYDYKFKDFDPLKLENLKIISNPISNKNKKKNAERYIRISQESLEEYLLKKNRKQKYSKDDAISLKIEELIENLDIQEYDKGKELLNEIITKLSEKAISMFHSQP
ncbi:MAG: HNH endonuclease [Methanobrevibacter sp.]|nr:HNH endonuclease [Candidatus Methanoflexus mossambicus]